MLMAMLYDTVKFIKALFIFTTFYIVACSTKYEDSKQTIAILKDTSSHKFDGLYVGLEEMCWTDSAGKKECYIDPANSKRKWYHLTYIKIKGDSAFVDQNPVSIYKKDTGFSASDGAFYYYSGLFKTKDTTIIFNLTELFCDYCGHL
jgi:hypothetical protein